MVFCSGGATSFLLLSSLHQEVERMEIFSTVFSLGSSEPSEPS